MSSSVRFSAALACALAIFGIGSASASEFHGIGFVKGCASPVPVGAQYECTYRIFNSFDSTHDTLRVTSLVDSVSTSTGAVSPGNILSSAALVFSGPVTCSGGTGSGTSVDPYIGATQCLVPYGASIETKPYSFYTVQAGDLGLPNQRLVDNATLSWNNMCVVASADCNTGARLDSARGSAVIGTGPQSVDFHGIEFSKDCATPVPVGAPHLCTLRVANSVDSAHDTLRISGLSDNVEAAGGLDASGNILGTVGLVLSGGASCTGGHGQGTARHPYVGATACLVPFGASIQTAPFEHYTVQPADATLPGGRLFDNALLQWSNTCTAGAGDCITDLATATAGTTVHVFMPAFIAFHKPPRPHKAGTPLSLAFSLGDPLGGALDDDDAAALAASCAVTVELDTLGPQCASYDAGPDRFRVKIQTPKTLAGGQYPLTIAVDGVAVHTEQVTITSH